MTDTFTKHVPHEIKAGYGAWFAPIHKDEFSDAIAEAEAEVVRIAPDTVRLFAGALCVVTDEGFGIPVDLFEELGDLHTDDTHDLRCRWFATEQEAKEHIAYTLERWNNPEPWESFVQL